MFFIKNFFFVKSVVWIWNSIIIIGEMNSKPWFEILTSVHKYIIYWIHIIKKASHIIWTLLQSFFCQHVHFSGTSGVWGRNRLEQKRIVSKITNCQFTSGRIEHELLFFCLIKNSRELRFLCNVVPWCLGALMLCHDLA